MTALCPRPFGRVGTAPIARRLVNIFGQNSVGPGVAQVISGNDIGVMAALGWNMTAQGVTAEQAAQIYNVA